jgi:hypothetical protein
MLYKLRIFLETNGEDVYRDIEIENTALLEDLHNVIVQSFDFEGNEMASFYLTDKELNQGMEIPLFNMDETQSANNMMSNTELIDVISKDSPNLLYVYDFFSMWRFLIGLMDTGEEEPGIEYPQVVHAQGIRPEEAPELDFSEPIDDNENDIFEGDNPFGDYYDFDDEWN